MNTYYIIKIDVLYDKNIKSNLYLHYIQVYCMVNFFSTITQKK